MSTASRRADFFVLEAAEYVNDLSQLVTQREPADAERLVRGARALRGAALMAGLGTFARAAASLEGIARSVRDHALAWDPHARHGWQEGLTTLRGLIARAPTWEAEDDRRALDLAERLERIAGGLPAHQTPVPVASMLTPGVRAFIARESVLIAGSLEQAAHALAPVPPPAALAAVLERMRALRGLGASTDLSPLPELLDAMEVATRTLLAEHPAPPDAAALFADAAQALTAMARNVADHGRVTPPPELDGVARRLLDSYAGEHDVVPIAELAPAGADSIARRGSMTASIAEADPVPVELVSVGDHLLLTAESLGRGGTPAARDLRLFVLHRTLSTMPPRSGTARFLSPIVDAIRTAVARGMPATRPDAFVGFLRDCGRFLVDAGAEPDRGAITAHRDAVVAAVLGERAAPVATALTAGVTLDDETDDTEIVPIGSLAPDLAEPLDATVPDVEDDVVDIADLAPDDHVVPIASLAPDDNAAGANRIPEAAPGEAGRLERAFVRRQTLRRDLGEGDASIESLIGVEIVEIVTLIYRGDGALRRAAELRAEVERLLAGHDTTIGDLRPVLDELLDLVPLARDAA